MSPDSPARPPRAAVVIASLLLLLIAVTAIFADTQLVRSERVRIETQPRTIEYDGSLYHVGLVRRESWLLRRRLADEVMVGRDPGLGYGHPVYFEILGDRDPELAAVHWRAEGVSVRFDSGHEIFLPAASFTGGR
ncbi:hypothetical protein [Nocardia sp. X0981]